MRIRDFLSQSNAIINVRAHHKRRLLKELCDKATSTLKLDADLVFADILKREDPVRAVEIDPHRTRGALHRTDFDHDIWPDRIDQRGDYGCHGRYRRTFQAVVLSQHIADQRHARWRCLLAY